MPEDRSNVGAMLVDALASWPDRIAFRDAEGEISYAAFAQMVRRALAAFREAGLAPGDVVAQLSENRWRQYALLAAAYIGGYRSLTLHAMAGEADQKFILEDSAARLLVSTSKHAERAGRIAAALPQLRLLGHEAKGPLPCFWAVAENAELPPLDPVPDSETVVRIAYTGGTTGLPKGVLLSSRALAANARAALAGIDWPADPVFLCPAPISHGAGSIVLPTLMQGGTVILQPAFSTESFYAAAREHCASVTWLVPTMVEALMAAPPEQSAPHLKTLIYSGAPMAPDRIRRALDRFGPVLVQCYGQTEAPNTISILAREDHIGASDKRLSSAGRPTDAVELRIVDERGQKTPAGEAGEICVRGPLVMSGYLERPEETAAALAGGWLHTGDIGRIDEEGYLHILDRKKDMIISGGFNVYPKEVEDVIAADPAVAAVAVIGLPDPKWGEAVVACVVPAAEHLLDAASIQARVRAAKGPVQTPKQVLTLDAMPLTPLGKVDKRALRARLMRLTAAPAHDRPALQP